MKTQPPDFLVYNASSVVLFTPQTEAAQTWLGEHCPAAGGEHTYFGPSLAVERRYVRALSQRAVEDGLTLS
jgi:hypothetical protein